MTLFGAMTGGVQGGITITTGQTNSSVVHWHKNRPTKRVDVSRAYESRDQLMRATVNIRVLDANTFLRDSLIGSYQFDLLGIYVEQVKRKAATDVFMKLGILRLDKQCGEKEGIQPDATPCGSRR